jgi:hypothetical protein
MPFAYSVPWPTDTALDLLAGSRLAWVGKGWTASADSTGQGTTLLARAGFVADPALRRKTSEGWTYHGHRKPLATFRRPRVPTSAEYETRRGTRILLPLAELAPLAVDFTTGQAMGMAEEWAARAWAAHDSRESFTRDGVDMWRLPGPILEHWTTLFLCIQATHAITVEALTDTRDLTTEDLCPALQTVWGYGPAGK